MSTKKICAIVDPYSSSNLYAPALKEQGYDCVAVLSQAIPTDIIANSLKAGIYRQFLHSSKSSQIGKRFAFHGPSLSSQIF